MYVTSLVNDDKNHLLNFKNLYGLKWATKYSKQIILEKIKSDDYK